MNEPQPARFSGYDAQGEATWTWTWLGVEGYGDDSVSDWPARWVGDEIVL